MENVHKISKIQFVTGTDEWIFLPEISGPQQVSDFLDRSAEKRIVSGLQKDMRKDGYLKKQAANYRTILTEVPSVYGVCDGADDPSSGVGPLSPGVSCGVFSAAIDYSWNF